MDGRAFLVAELLQGSTLKARLTRDGAMDAATALATILPLAGAVAVAHDRGILHRDIKPANVLLVANASSHPRPMLRREYVPPSA